MGHKAENVGAFALHGLITAINAEIRQTKARLSLEGRLPAITLFRGRLAGYQKLMMVLCGELHLVTDDITDTGDPSFFKRLDPDGSFSVADLDIADDVLFALEIDAANLTARLAWREVENRLSILIEAATPFVWENGEKGGEIESLRFPGEFFALVHACYEARKAREAAKKAARRGAKAIKKEACHG